MMPRDLGVYAARRIRSIHDQELADTIEGEKRRRRTKRVDAGGDTADLPVRKVQSVRRATPSSVNKTDSEVRVDGSGDGHVHGDLSESTHGVVGDVLLRRLRADAARTGREERLRAAIARSAFADDYDAQQHYDAVLRLLFTANA